MMGVKKKCEWLKWNWLKATLILIALAIFGYSVIFLRLDFGEPFRNPIFQTVISGVSVLVLGDLIKKFIIEPAQEYKEIVGKIDNELKFYANIISNPEILQEGKKKECYETLRRLSCNLEAKRKKMVFRKDTTDKNVADAAAKLIGLSNSLWELESGSRNSQTIEDIRKSLHIPYLVV